MSRLVLPVAATLPLLIAQAFAAPITFSSVGADPAAIQATVDAFRAALGANNGAAATPFPVGRREISWDGVPDNLAAPNPMPATQFQGRGVVFSTPGTGFQVSADSSNPTSTPIEFDNLFPGNAVLFRTFSPERLFTALNSTITDVTFVVPGSATPAHTTAFGAVFTDVDDANSSSLQFFDPLGASLGTYFVPNVSDSETLFFLGVLFNAGEQVGRVRITAGDQPISSPSCQDCVAMDDFIYAEPQAQLQALPEPATLSLMGAGLIGFLVGRRVRRI